MRDRAFYELADEIYNNVCEILCSPDCFRIISKLLGTKSESYGSTNMKIKRKACFKGYITFYQQEGKSDVVMLNSSASKLGVLVRK